MNKFFDKREFLRLIGSAAVAAPTAIVAAKSTQKNASARREASLFERVMETRTIRCGYLVWPPYLIKDVTTGRLSGVTYDMVIALAENLDLKFEWVQEIFLGQEAEVLNTGRVDMICGAESIYGPAMAKYLDYSDPYFSTPDYAYVRRDDTRHEGLASINSPAVKIAVMDGDLSVTLSRTLFPKARIDSLPNSSDPKQMAFEVMTGKADVALLDPPSYQIFNHAYPGTLKQLPGSKSIANYPSIFSVKKGETELCDLINNTIRYMQNIGQLDVLLDHCNMEPSTYFRIASPYQTPA
jgi:ABC-type amino acid transport substrate-binding protein